MNNGKEFTNNKASFDSPLLSLLCDPRWDLWDAYQNKLSPVSLNPGNLWIAASHQKLFNELIKFDRIVMTCGDP